MMMVFWCTVSLPVVGTIKNDSNSYSNDALYLVLVSGSVSSGLALTLSIYHGPFLRFARWIFNLLPDILQEPVIIIISRVLQSLLIPAIWLHRHPLRGVDSVHLQILLMGTCWKCGLWSVTGHNHRADEDLWQFLLWSENCSCLGLLECTAS